MLKIFEMNKIFNCDCIEGMKKLADNSVDMILCDLPFGITNCDWDKKIDLEKFWTEIHRVTKLNAACAMFAKSKFLIELANSNLKYYRYKWVWQKNLACGFLNAKKMPLCAHEDILIFYRKLPTYNPQFTPGKPYDATKHIHFSNNYKAGICFGTKNETGDRFPIDVQKFKTVFTEAKGNLVHSTQKPVALLEYLIKTYSNEGEVVLDATIGSGSTAVAAINTGRQFIGFELDKKYFDIACDRVAKAMQLQNTPKLFDDI